MCIVNNLCGLSLTTVGKVVAWASGILVSFELALFGLILLGKKDHPLFTTSSTALSFAFIFGLTHSVLLLVGCALLFYGAANKSPWFVVPWLVLTAIELISRFVNCVVKILEPGFNCIILIDCAIMGVIIWIWFLIFSLFLKLRRRRSSSVRVVNV